MKESMGLLGKRKNSGQATIMIALMSLTFVFFFIFVLTTGLLVNAKINLQNAADVAAYAGAATQARQLNTIAYLNYEMRRQFKKFLFRYYVLGTRSYDPEPAAPTRAWSMNGNPNPSEAFGVPAVCVVFNRKSNHCHVRALKPIQIPIKNPLDSVSVALADQLEQLEQIRQDQCRYSSFTNQQLLTLWLLNTDTNLDAVKAAIGAGGTGTVSSVQERRLVNETIARLAEGIGLIPREVLLRLRIDTVASYINSVAETDLNYDRVQQLKIPGAGNDPSMQERKINAFLSAYYTLGSGQEKDTFPRDGIRLTELLPGNTDQANLIELEDLKTTFDSFYVYFQPEKLNPPSGSCVARPCPVTVTQFPFGVAKKPSTLTYYAVKLEAETNLLLKRWLLPGLNGPLRLKAYSAAMPFGSRIGPPPSLAASGQSIFSRAASKGVLVETFLGSVPNLAVMDPGLTGPAPGGGDYYDSSVIAAYNSLFVPNPSTETIQLNADTYQAAMSPSPAEAKWYTILNDLPYMAGNNPDPIGNSVGSPFMRHFANGSSIHSVWAPITSSRMTPAEAKLKILSAITGSVSLSDPKCPSADDLIAGLRTRVDAYIASLQAGQGEDGETYTIARIRDPFRTTGTNGALQAVSVPGIPFDTSNSSGMVNNSWFSTKNNAYADRGRLGYSVKFVSFRTLLGSSPGMTSDGQVSWTNRGFFTDPDAQLDVEQLRH